jgi:predicted DNA-binding transcriptional regulator AlpA
MAAYSVHAPVAYDGEIVTYKHGRSACASPIVTRAAMSSECIWRRIQRRFGRTDQFPGETKLDCRNGALVWAAKDLSARIDVKTTAKLLGFAEHDIQILMALGKLTPLDDPALNARRNGLGLVVNGEYLIISQQMNY